MIFPPVNSGGPIEARELTEEYDAFSIFPPVNSGGPIEASLVLMTPLALVTISAG